MQEENIALGRQIGHVSHLFRRNIDNLIARESRDCADSSLTGRNFWVLRYLQDHPDGDVFQKDLEAAFKIRKSTVSCMVELMEQKGMLTRESVNGDARLKRLVLSGKTADGSVKRRGKNGKRGPRGIHGDGIRNADRIARKTIRRSGKPRTYYK